MTSLTIVSMFKQFYALHPRAATNWYFRGEKWCNLLLYLTNTHVFF